MEVKYTVFPNGSVKCEKNDEIWLIPALNDNTDYQQYLEWVAKGNTAEVGE